MDWKNANVLFADVKGYSSLSDEQMKTFTTKILSLIGSQINDLDIRDRNTWGDGIVLVSERIGDVCEAALKLRDIFKGTNWGRLQLPRLDIRISIHHGEYLAGVDGFTDRPTFVGRTIVTAARIEPVTPPGRIWITEEAALLLRRHIDSERKSLKPEFFSIDAIGEITLPKKYGNINILCLRRYDDPPLSEKELEEIRDAEKLRNASESGSDRNTDVSKIVREENIRSFYIVIGVVIDNGNVLLVKRRENPEGLDWMFPSGKKWPTKDEEETIEKEVLEETGILCQVIDKIAEVENHPLTDFRCLYFALEPADDDVDIVNGDPIENLDVEWVPITEAINRLGKHLNSSVSQYLRSQAAKRS